MFVNLLKISFAVGIFLGAEGGFFKAYASCQEEQEEKVNVTFILPHIDTGKPYNPRTDIEISFTVPSKAHSDYEEGMRLLDQEEERTRLLNQEEFINHDVNIYTRALELFERSANEGHIVAAAEAGYLYLEGKAIEIRNVRKALEYLVFSAEKGHLNMQLLLGCLYKKGWKCNTGVDIAPDIDKATHYYILLRENTPAGSTLRYEANAFMVDLLKSIPF